MPGLSPAIAALFARARLLALDVDGVLTDGSVLYGDAGEVQRFNVHDGQGLAWLREAGVHVTWISGRGCKATLRRAEELGVVEVHTRAGPKDEILAAVQKRLDVGREDTVAMGDDLPDLRLARRAGLFVAPADARPEVRERAALVTDASGGRGAVREVCEHLLRCRDAWTAIADRYGS
jgi:3-deoxy-D-manno-octulosonate 8-phosphate phosphatase (KDO 8-P phosphatase)